MVVGEIGGQTEGEREQPRGLRREFETRCIGAAYDQRERAERGVLDVVDLEEGIEAAQLAVMRERLGAGDVVRGRAGRGGHGEDALGRCEQECRLRFDEAADEPWAGDAVDLRPLAGHPFTRVRHALIAQRQPELGPSRDASFEIAGADTACLKGGSDFLAYLMALLAIDNDRAAVRQVVHPTLDFARNPPQRSDQHTIVGVEAGAAAHVEDER